MVVPVDGAGDGASRDFMNRTWRANGLKPRLWRTFKLSGGPRFEEKLRDVAGLYLGPLENAAVFSFDEKSPIQVLDRTQPGLPMKKGRCGTTTHDHKQHGTTLQDSGGITNYGIYL